MWTDRQYPLNNKNSFTLLNYHDAISCIAALPKVSNLIVLVSAQPCNKKTAPAPKRNYFTQLLSVPWRTIEYVHIHTAWTVGTEYSPAPSLILYSNSEFVFSFKIAVITTRGFPNIAGTIQQAARSLQAEFEFVLLWRGVMPTSLLKRRGKQHELLIAMQQTESETAWMAGMQRAPACYKVKLF